MHIQMVNKNVNINQDIIQYQWEGSMNLNGVSTWSYQANSSGYHIP